jgi:hypothetical protein
MYLLLRFMIGLLFIPAGAFACFPCMPWLTYNSEFQIVSRERQSSESNADVRLFLIKKVEPGYISPIKLSCLSEYGIGQQIWSGKTNRSGKIDPSIMASGTYWMAIKSEREEGVYIITIPDKRDHKSKTLKLEISEGGLVNNKCGVEPIELFFKDR